MTKQEQWSEIISAFILGLVTVATAWSGYQSARWGGVQSTLYSRPVRCERSRPAPLLRLDNSSR
jgi:hypothetical protein